MAEIDLRYLCTTIGNLAGVPIRLYENDNLVFYYSLAELPKDPMAVCKAEVFAVKTHVGYVMTPTFHYYGIVNGSVTGAGCTGPEGSACTGPEGSACTGPEGSVVRLVIGPSRQIPETAQELRNLAFDLDVEERDLSDFISGMKSIVRMPFESILQILCTINHVLNGERLSLKDISIYEKDQEKLIELQNKAESSYKLDVKPDQNQSLHNTYDLEESIMRIVRKGDTAALKEWVSHAPAVRGGVLAFEQLRQRKNMFIVSVTLASRAAIRGGMDVNDAFSISDSYIQQCELMSSPLEINNLQYRMITDYTERVSRLRLGATPTSLVIAVSNYLQHHMSEPCSVEDIASEVCLSRPYLSRRFKAETGENLTDFILKQKTEEAKRLLRYSDKSLTSIGLYLGFSSSSHFTRVFKKYVGYNPREYRKLHE